MSTINNFNTNQNFFTQISSDLQQINNDLQKLDANPHSSIPARTPFSEGDITDSPSTKDVMASSNNSNHSSQFNLSSIKSRISKIVANIQQILRNSIQQSSSDKNYKHNSPNQKNNLSLDHTHSPSSNSTPTEGGAESKNSLQIGPSENKTASTSAASTTSNHTNGPYSLSQSNVRVDSVGTNYITDSMLQSAKSDKLTSESQYDAFIDANASKFGLDPEIVKREYRVESSGNPNALGDTSRDWAQGGPSIGLLQVTSGILAGGTWAHPGMETTSGQSLTTGDLEGSAAVQLLAGMQHLADYKNEAGASLGANASPSSIYTQALGNYVGHDQSSYINNIENTVLS